MDDVTFSWLGDDEQAVSDQVIENARLAFAPKRTPEVQRELVTRLRATPWGQRRWHVATLRDGRGDVVASLSLYDIVLRLDTQRLRVGGIGGVAVPEALRRRGHGRALMTATHDWLRDEGYDGALLFSAIGEDYYARLGYESLWAERLEADLSTLERPVPSPSRVRPFSELDLPAVADLQARDQALQRLSCVRVEGEWEIALLQMSLHEELLSPPALPARFLVGEREGRVVSFARFGRRDDGDLVLLEYGFEPGAKEDVAAFVHWQLQGLGEDRPRRLHGIAPRRLQNLLPVASLAWERETGSIPMLLSFGSFDVPSGLPHDERLIWRTDWF